MYGARPTFVHGRAQDGGAVARLTVGDAVLSEGWGVCADAAMQDAVRRALELLCGDDAA
jgi:hypothetical protein